MLKKTSLYCALILSLFTAGIIACASTQPVKAQPEEIRNAKTSLDWEGQYEGEIPSASGSGIHVTLTLHSDHTFLMVYDYIGREDSISNAEGTFTWDEAGNVVILEHESLPPYYQVGEGYLRQLDLEGNAITGNLAEMYVLRKTE